MAANKNQHFVPRCYLRPFSRVGAPDAINLFNLDRLKFIENAPLKHQCAKPYFYGRDLLVETALQTTEGVYADVLRKVLSPGYALIDAHRDLLRRFWLLQRQRTEAASRHAIEMLKTMGETAGIPPDQYKMEIKEAVQSAISLFVQEMHVIDDLKVCLVRNRSPVPFITSDDPAVLTNRWYLEDLRARPFGGFGLSNAGAVALLPLSPRVLCVAYDGDVYSLPNVGGWVEVSDQSDVEAFNQHQYLNARANIYVRDAEDAAFVRDTYRAAAVLRPKSRHGARYAIRDGGSEGDERFRVVKLEEAGEHTQAIVHTYTIHPHPSTWPRTLRWRSRGFVFSDGSGVGYVRRTVAQTSGRTGFRKERTGR
jgi:hypothetical protein